MKDYLTIGQWAAHEIIINKSRFIGITYPVSSDEEIPLCIEDARSKYPDASHYCFGCIPDIDGLIQRFSDDGEPGGTAGMPIIQVLLQKELRKLLVVVVRYFGGIKLGAGGLVRAYTKAAVEAIDNAGVVKMTFSSKGSLWIDYSLLGSVEYYLRQNGIPILYTSYEEKVRIDIMTNKPWEAVTGKLIDICSGNIEIERMEGVYHCWEEN